MRSLIILEVEHGEDTDSLDAFSGLCQDVVPEILENCGYDVEVNDYTVRVDLDPFITVQSVNAIIDSGRGN